MSYEIIEKIDRGSGVIERKLIEAKVSVLTVDHDPKTVATDAPKGSIVVNASGEVFRKLDDGSTTNVRRMAACNHLSMIMGSGTIAVDCGNEVQVHVHVKATGNVTIDPTNFADTMFLFMMTEQDSVGGWTFTFPTTEFENGNPPTQSTAANAMDTWIWGNMGGKFHRHGFEKGVK